MKVLRVDLFFLCLLLSYNNHFFSQKVNAFSGELHYVIQRVDKTDSVKAEMIIYARDSLLRVVNFNSESGKQELIKHLRFNKSYLLIETPEQKYAIRTNEHLEKDSSKNYSFRKKMGFKKFSGLRAKKLKVRLKDVKNELTFYYLKNTPAKYANAYIDLPGLPVLYYVSTDHGVYQYKLKEIKRVIPPVQLFSFGTEYKIVTFEQFSEEFLKKYENNDVGH